MNPFPKALSLANIHSVYSGAEVKTAPDPTPSKATGSRVSYKTTNQFAREPNHSGTAPSKPLAPNTRFRR
jgi:hypothetical protein